MAGANTTDPIRSHLPPLQAPAVAADGSAAASDSDLLPTELRAATEPWQRGVADVEGDVDSACPVMQPDHPFRKKWDGAQVIALVYVAVLVPVRIGFGFEMEPGTWEWIVELISDLYFVADIIINFRTGFVDENGRLEMRPRLIARQYSRRWLVVDVVSCLPIAYVTQIMEANSSKSEGGGTNVKIFKILRLLRLAKLLRLGRLKKIIKRHEEEMEGLMGILKVLGVVVMMSYTCHMLACGWYYVGGDVKIGDGLEPQRGWIHNQKESGLQEIPFATAYITSYYWAITTISTVGFGDISGTTNQERMYSVIAEMVGCLMFAMLTGALGSMMVGQKLLEEKVDKQLSELREFMESKGIPKALRTKIRRYMETLYEHKTGFDEGEVLRQLPPPMAKELLQYMYYNVLEGVPMFKVLEEGGI